MRLMTRCLSMLTIAALLIALVPTPARAGTTPAFTLETSAVHTTGTSAGGGIAVTGVTEILVYVTCTASSAPTRLDVWLQTSMDGGGNWYDMPHEAQMLTAVAGTDITANTAKRNILDNVTSCAAIQRAVARYRNFGGLVRLAWVVSGTSFTFEAKAVGKY